MNLSKRLLWIADKIQNETIIDVGTDHGYIPIYLLKKNIIKHAVASDINEGPLKKARINASIEGVSDRIDFKLGSGLEVLEDDEPECALIAGMGANLIRDILENNISKVKKLKTIILQPAQNPEVLREHLYNNCYEILDEDICFDENKYYELFVVRYGKRNGVKLEDIFYEISPFLLKNHKEIMKEYLDKKILHNKKIISYIKDDTISAQERKVLLEKKNEIISDILNNLKKDDNNDGMC
ncbi:class I SAM-dependent methyltransferase [Clostridium sp. BJN0001]|uniref:tRNA (adenine(22)-N(1))-methyltransferase n=1 Tax=Clostridium sp. BJN0001 TaxID=2930219 RepID=UPI001FD0AAB7|nr:class I SAM-dependent methyltransferase [Clostridium sp. BJN0001]